MNDEDENLNESQNEAGLQEQAQQVQNAANKAVQSAKKAKARAQAIARAPGQAVKASGQALETTGKVLEITGKGLQLLGKGMQFVGKGMQQAGKGIYNASKALFDAGQSLCGTGIGAIAGIPMMIAGILGMGVGKLTELLGKVMELIGKVLEKIGKLIEKIGKALAKMGKRLKDIGNKMIQAANAATGAGGAGGSGLAGGGGPGDESGSGSETGGIPSLFGGKSGSTKKKVILIVILAIVAVLFAILSKESTIDDGTYEEGSKKNVPYVVSSYVMDDLVIVNDSTGNYTYAFKNDEGEIISLEEAIDNAIEVLVSNGSHSLTNLGDNSASQKELITKMIQAEIATQYPDLTLNEDLGLDASTSAAASGSSNDYCVDMDNQTALPACTEEQLIEMINASSVSQQGKNNMLSVVPDLVRFQEQYKVNAVFFMSAIRAESGWGTGWDLIDSSTYNWASVKGDANGGYVDRNGTSWNRYNNYTEATEAWFRLISNPSGYYFGSQRYTVYQIGPTYCNLEWSNTVSGFIEEFYGYIGVTPTIADTSIGTASSVGAGKTGTIKTTEEINQDETVHGGIKIQRKDENGNLIELKYTSTENFNALVSTNSAEALNYYTLVKTGGTTTSSSGGVVLEGNDVAEQVWNFLINDMGYNEYVAAGIMGNIENESSFQPTADNGTHYGLCQWSKSYCPEVNGADLTGQLEYFGPWITSEFDDYAKNYKSGFSYAEFLQLQDAGQAAIAFATVMERFGSPYSGGGASDPEYAERAQDAQNYYVTYAGTASGSSGTTSSSSSSTVATSGSFADIAKQCHAYLRENGYSYDNSGRSLPVEAGDCGYIDCTAYISMVLDNFGRKDWSGYPHQLTSTSMVDYGKSSLETVHSGKVTNISEISGKLQPGDIIVQTSYGDTTSSNPGHAQIFYGFNGAGQAIWLNCGGNSSIGRVEGEDAYNDFSNQPILYVFRVQGGSSSEAAVQSLDNFLFIGDSRYEGIESQLEALGNNITAIGVGCSMPKNWIQPVIKGGGVVYRGETTTDGEDIGTLPTSVSGVSVMLGVNGVTGSLQVDQMQTLLKNLHSKYPNAPIFVNSVYHLGTAYGSGTDSMNIAVDEFNQAMKDFCNQNDWAYYIDVTENLDDASGYLKSEYSGDGLHISSTEGITTLVSNIESKILNSGATTSSNSDANSRPGYSLVVANRKDVNTIVVNEYDYRTSWVTDIGHGGHEDPNARFSADIPTETVTNETVTTYNSSTIDYQTSLQNFTLYFDFLWAILCDSGNVDLVSQWANLAYDSESTQSQVVITTYNDVSVSQSGPTEQSKGYVTRSSGNNNGINISDRYDVTEITTITTTNLTSKPCITYADTWLMKYENDASTYSEYKSKSQEIVTEKTDANSTEQNIIKILKSKPNVLETLTKEQYMVEEMLKDNEKVSFMIDIYDYILKIANGKEDEIEFSLSSLLDTNLFDLTTKETTATTKVLLYDSISISEGDKELLYKTVEKICESYGTSDENYQRKKYITSVILNRVLSAEFPNSVSEVINQEYQFENFEPSMLANQITVSEETKDAVDYVLIGGDCSQYSVYFAKPSTATANNWDTLYKFTVNDGDGSDSSFNYYTTESIIAELQRYEVTITGSLTKSSETAQDIVKWAKAQVGKSEYINRHNNETVSSTNTCAQFVKSAYYEAGLEYISGNAIDLPHPNAMELRNDGTVNWTDIPVGAIIVSEGTPVNGVQYGHVALYVGNGYVIEAGGSEVQKVPIDQSYGAGKFLGWGFAMSDQDKAYEKLVVTIGSNYAEGWTYIGSYNEISDGIAGIYKLGNKAYKIYVQGYNGNAPWARSPYSHGTYSTSACGATSVSIIATGYGHDVTPPDVGAVIYSSVGVPNGSYTNVVTAHYALSNGLNHYGINHSWSYTATQEQIIEHLKQGKPVIWNVHNYTIGNKTYSGHYVTLLGMNAHGQIFLGDPAAGGSNNGYFDVSKIFTSGSTYDVCFID